METAQSPVELPVLHVHQWRRSKFPSHTLKRVSQLSMRFMCLLTVPVASFECKQILKREYLYSIKIQFNCER